MALPSFTNIIVFLLPGAYLPPNTTAAIYMQSPISLGSEPLGEISNEKPSIMVESLIKYELPKARIQVGIEITARERWGSGLKGEAIVTYEERATHGIL